MKKLNFKKLVFCFSLLFLTFQVHASDVFLRIGKSEIYIPGFRTYFSDEYNISEKNAELLRALKSTLSPAKINDFTSSNPGMTKLSCRGSYPIYAPAKTPYETFISAALQHELSKSDLYSAENGVPISIELTLVDFKSIGDAKWTIEATFTALGKEAVTIKNETFFDVSFAASNACGQVSAAFVPAIQEFLFKVYSDQKFQELLK